MFSGGPSREGGGGGKDEEEKMETEEEVTCHICHFYRITFQAPLNLSHLSPTFHRRMCHLVKNYRRIGDLSHVSLLEIYLSSPPQIVPCFAYFLRTFHRPLCHLLFKKNPHVSANVKKY